MTDLSRRQVILASGAILIATPAAARQAGQPATSSQRWGLLIDTAKCGAECTICVDACKAEMGLGGHDRPRTDAQYIRKVNVRDPASGAAHSVPVMCQHCAKPACVDVCPTGASMKRADGIVLVDRHICIGCRYCMMACPYKARSFAHEEQTGQQPHLPRGKGTVEGCTLCVHRIDEGKMPACVEACASRAKGAMLFGDLNDQSSEIAQRVAREATTRIRADLGLEPAVRYQGI
ncbi:Sulfite reduction-associated complex DsrMKJOP iron-sulfur protein DsrO (HmeA) [Paramagnetospirillum magnetotacticum MS-1]|uniref:Sulfite reduction-associated complex DsrMKJOP iron-sulfur protein DsrO (HmeA) n=1 Tax=Paramagnetospirillum magnetotacticum MS-1 TaxID=272627 RepID=A0A0C2V6E0_PARME|nr:4Fe-4S dicluster domain-containing protein [Paramagnetospirillum magnetotacticum]KIM00607.1 Sulfite reduction-associated complex DsrMKJOP iron-sulfur protein DsrO (HmeA) [Paramagnetospirillum magnetotacticum MS-1]